MENNQLKEKIRKNIKEEIAISNIRKEFDMKNNENRKIIYIISSICALFILVIGIFIGTNKIDNNLFREFGKVEENKNKEETLDIELNINSLKILAMLDLDANIENIELSELSKEFLFIENLSLPVEYKFENSYIVYTRENKQTTEYNKIHDYVVQYKKDDTNNIKIAFSKVEQPLRDYFIEEGDKISKIGNVKLNISQNKEMYIITFKYNDIYFDIETTGITENQLIDLIDSLIN